MREQGGDEDPQDGPHVAAARIRVDVSEAENPGGEKGPGDEAGGAIEEHLVQRAAFARGESGDSQADETGAGPHGSLEARTVSDACGPSSRESRLIVRRLRA